MFKLKANRLEGVPFTAAQWTGGTIVPEIVVLHDTASRLDLGNAAAYLAKNTARVSVHFVVERDGAVTQQVPTNRRANHAGVSSYHGRQSCNDFALGIEIVNPGRMIRVDERNAQAWWGERFGTITNSIEERTTPEHGHGLWMHYTAPQIAAVTDILDALFAGIRSLSDITTHWYVSPGRKVDVNPLFPLAEVRARVLGHDDPAAAIAHAQSAAAPLEGPASEPVTIVSHTPGDTLNLRAWPSFNPNVIARIPDGTVLPFLRIGRFAGQLWAEVRYAGRKGWVSNAYIKDTPE